MPCRRGLCAVDPRTIRDIVAAFELAGNRATPHAEYSSTEPVGTRLNIRTRPRTDQQDRLGCLNLAHSEGAGVNADGSGVPVWGDSTSTMSARMGLRSFRSSSCSAFP